MAHHGDPTPTQAIDSLPKSKVREEYLRSASPELARTILASKGPAPDDQNYHKQEQYGLAL